MRANGSNVSRGICNLSEGRRMGAFFGGGKGAEICFQIFRLQNVRFQSPSHAAVDTARPKGMATFLCAEAKFDGAGFEKECPI